MEWSFKKAITIQTYSTNHPIPVPLNLIWWIYLLCKKRTTFLSQSCNGLNCLRCLACCKRREREDDDEDNTKALVSPVCLLRAKYHCRDLKQLNFSNTLPVIQQNTILYMFCSKIKASLLLFSRQRETLNAVVKNLQVTYFTTYGYSFPITGKTLQWNKKIIFHLGYRCDPRYVAGFKTLPLYFICENLQTAPRYLQVCIGKLHAYITTKQD